LQAKKLIAAILAKTRRVWSSYVTLVDRLCYPHPQGINLFILKLLQNVKSCVLPWDKSLYIQTQIEKISIENIIFMLQIVTNMNEALIILQLYNGWPEFNEIQMVKPRRNYVLNLKKLINNS
jgi:hypothetical protein